MKKVKKNLGFYAQAGKIIQFLIFTHYFVYWITKKEIMFHKTKKFLSEPLYFKLYI